MSQQQMAEAETVLLIGVTGGTGHQAVRGFRAAGVSRLLAMSRDGSTDNCRQLQKTGVEIVYGDLDDAASLARAFSDVDVIYIHALSADSGVADPQEVPRGERVATAATSAAVKHIIYNSVEGCDRQSGVPHMDNVFAVEERLAACNTPFTALRAPLFMEEWYKHHTRPRILEGVFALAHQPGYVQQYISVRDMGTIAARVMADRALYQNQRLAVASDELACTEVADLFAEAQGSPVQFSPLPIEMFQGMPGTEELVTLINWYNHHGHQCDVAETRAAFPGLWPLQEFLAQTAWGERDKGYEKFADGSLD